jgi:hypothetical protein
MKSDIDIKDIIYDYLKGSALAEAVTGQLLKTRRPKNSDKEDIVISVLANEGSQRQEAVVNVNVYVEDVIIDGQPEEDTIRLRTLCGIAMQSITETHFRTAWLKPAPPRVYEADGIDWHIINNRINFKIINE